MRTVILAVVLALAAASSSFAANDNQSRNMGGYHVGPMGQCLGCGGRRSFAFAPGWCHTVRERVVLDDGDVVFRRHRVCP